MAIKSITRYSLQGNWSCVSFIVSMQNRLATIYLMRPPSITSITSTTSYIRALNETAATTGLTSDHSWETNLIIQCSMVREMNHAFDTNRLHSCFFFRYRNRSTIKLTDSRHLLRLRFQYFIFYQTQDRNRRSAIKAAKGDLLRDLNKILWRSICSANLWSTRNRAMISLSARLRRVSNCPVSSVYLIKFSSTSGRDRGQLFCSSSNGTIISWLGMGRLWSVEAGQEASGDLHFITELYKYSQWTASSLRPTCPIYILLCAAFNDRVVGMIRSCVCVRYCCDRQWSLQR